MHQPVYSYLPSGCLEDPHIGRLTGFPVPWMTTQPPGKPARQQKSEPAARFLGPACCLGVVDRDKLVKWLADPVRNAGRVMEIRRGLPANLHALPIAAIVHGVSPDCSCLVPNSAIYTKEVPPAGRRGIIAGVP